MDVVLDETGLLPCLDLIPAQRISTLAATLKCLDSLGCARVLRSVRDAADRNIHLGRGLRDWCFDRATDRDAGRLIAYRLGKQPFIDGETGLFAQIEGHRVMEGALNGQSAMGLAYAALCGLPAVSLGHLSAHPLEGANRGQEGEITVEISILDEEGVRTEYLSALRLVTATEVSRHEAQLLQRLHQDVKDGETLMAQAAELFPRLVFGPLAQKQIKVLNGNETVFRQLLRHLCALDRGAAGWLAGEKFQPGEQISWSDESTPTLNKFGARREFPMPEGFDAVVWRLHSKLTGGDRLYFHPIFSLGNHSQVLIGYFGPHLATIKYPSP